jgi:hypothetical protein
MGPLFQSEDCLHIQNKKGTPMTTALVTGGDLEGDGAIISTKLS